MQDKPKIKDTFKQFFKDKQEAFMQLTPRERKVLSMRFGLDDEVTHTLKETAKEFGVTRERIRQIQAKALERMRRS